MNVESTSNGAVNNRGDHQHLQMMQGDPSQINSQYQTPNKLEQAMRQRGRQHANRSREGSLNNFPQDASAGMGPGSGLASHAPGIGSRATQRSRVTQAEQQIAPGLGRGYELSRQLNNQSINSALIGSPNGNKSLSNSKAMRAGVDMNSSIASKNSGNFTGANDPLLNKLK